MRKIDEIILHCAATKPSMDIGAAEIRHWHVDENGWADIGYHYVIRRNGEVEPGRPVETAGAHCYGHNARSIGICLVGGLAQDGKRAENNFTPEQFNALAELIRELLAAYPTIVKISGHSDYANKACPVFDVREFLYDYDFGEICGNA